MNRTIALALATAATLAAGLLPASSTSAAAADDGLARPARSPQAALPALHATHGVGAVIRNADGAQVLLRGVNMNGLVEYYRPNPRYAPVVPQTREDFRRVARLGFNSVRLLVSWSRLQPTRGAYDTAYVAKVRRAVRLAADYGLYSVIDMHQDAYGTDVDTPVGTVCPSGTHPDNGWDGAPGWATITDGASTCTSGEREVAPAVMAAWEHFYDNTGGIQTQLVRTWGRLAKDLARSSSVAGFDLLNEPGFGTGPDTDGRLGRFYGRAIKAIRAGERQGGGFSHIVFFEPSVYWSAFGSTTTPDPTFTQDANLVFAPHIYAESLSGNTIGDGFSIAKAVADSYGVPVWSGEWGFFPQDPAEKASAVARYGAAEDAYRYGGAWWVWEQACGNPHMIAGPGGEPGQISQSLNRFDCPSGRSLGISPVFADVLSRPTAWAVPGHISLLRSDGTTGRFELRGKAAKRGDRCALRVFVPKRFAGARVRAHGITHLERRPHRGNVVLRGCVADSFRLRLG